MNKLLTERMAAGVSKLRDVLATCRLATICLDGWTKKGLSALLNLDLLEHPHTGEMLSKSLEKCLTHWGISEVKVLQIISDNGANMVKAVNLLRERTEEEEDKVEDKEEAVDGCDDTGEESPLLTHR